MDKSKKYKKAAKKKKKAGNSRDREEKHRAAAREGTGSFWEEMEEFKISSRHRQQHQRLSGTGGELQTAI